MGLNLIGVELIKKEETEEYIMKIEKLIEILDKVDVEEGKEIYDITIDEEIEEGNRLLIVLY